MLPGASSPDSMSGRMCDAKHPGCQEIVATAIAAALGVGPERVNVKATTGERIGFVGRGEGAVAMAVATIS